MWGKGPLARGCDDRLTPSRMCQECVRTAGSSVQAGRERIWTATGGASLGNDAHPWVLDRGAVIGDRANDASGTEDLKASPTASTGKMQPRTY